MLENIKILGIVIGVATLIAVPSLLSGEKATTSQYKPQISDFSTPNDTDYGWWLKVPEIGLESQMQRVFAKDGTIPAPNEKAGYYLEKQGNIFINGHREGIFKRLGELPSEIALKIDGESTKYALESHEITPKEQVSMEKALSYQGVVIMTCDGTPTNGKYPDILTLYYKEK